MLGGAWGSVYPGSGVTQPWNGVVFPTADSNWTVGGASEVTTAQQLRAIPAIGRALALIEGMAMQMPLDAVRGDVVLARPRLLEQPDPTVDRAWFTSQMVDDYLVHGNALCLVTARDALGWPAAVARLAPELTDMVVDVDGRREYWVGGRLLPTADVVHVRRGADPLLPGRGVGVLEQYTRSLSLMGKQTQYEAAVLDGAAVPSAAVITPNSKPSQEELDAASDRWMDKFSGPQRRPVFLPNGSSVVPLSWSPADSQLVEARQLSLTDAANIMNLDAFWLGGSIASGLTYRSPGPMWLNLLRQTVAPILEPFELTWSQAWLPRGQRVRFGRRVVLEDDMGTTVGWVGQAVSGGLMTLSEGRVFLGLSADVPAELKAKQKQQQLPPVPPAGNDQDNNEIEEDESGE